MLLPSARILALRCTAQTPQAFSVLTTGWGIDSILVYPASLAFPPKKKNRLSKFIALTCLVQKV